MLICVARATQLTLAASAIYRYVIAKTFYRELQLESLHAKNEGANGHTGCSRKLLVNLQDGSRSISMAFLFWRFSTSPAIPSSVLFFARVEQIERAFGRKCAVFLRN